MLPVMQVGRVRPGVSPEHDVLHPVGGGLGQARPTNNIGIHEATIALHESTQDPGDKAIPNHSPNPSRIGLGLRHAFLTQAVANLRDVQPPLIWVGAKTEHWFFHATN
ncbi:MAG: hypothetical protein FJ404_19220 [Verrucomicrobia bacterium]|nr:hypothetical protein [Verrucomicrobiota bacterium]